MKLMHWCNIVRVNRMTVFTLQSPVSLFNGKRGGQTSRIATAHTTKTIALHVTNGVPECVGRTKMRSSRWVYKETVFICSRRWLNIGGIYINTHVRATCLFILLVWMSLTTLVGIVRKKSRLKFRCIRSHTEHRWASKMFAFLIVMRHRACMSESIEWNDHGGNSHWLSWLLKLIVLAAKIEKRKTKLKNPARRLYKHVCGGDDDGALAVTVYSVSVRKFSYTSHVKRNGRVSMPVAAVAAATAAI